MGSLMGIYETFVNKGSIDFFLCVGGSKDFSSDLFLTNKALLKSKDQLFDEVLSIFLFKLTFF